MIHILDRLKQGDTKFHQTRQKGVQFKTYELFISGTVH
jgi:hypothetical protein